MIKYFYTISKIPSQHVLLGSERKKQKLLKSFHEEIIEMEDMPRCIFNLIN